MDIRSTDDVHARFRRQATYDLSHRYGIDRYELDLGPCRTERFLTLQGRVPYLVCDGLVDIDGVRFPIEVAQRVDTTGRHRAVEVRLFHPGRFVLRRVRDRSSIDPHRSRPAR